MKVLVLLTYTALSLVVVKPPENERFLQLKELAYSTHSAAKTKAFKILQKKCNVCHISRNRKKVFELDNMDALAPKIYTQVFIKKRMPKGNKIILTNQESIAIKQWLDSININ